MRVLNLHDINRLLCIIEDFYGARGFFTTTQPAKIELRRLSRHLDGDLSLEGQSGHRLEGVIAVDGDAFGFFAGKVRGVKGGADRSFLAWRNDIFRNHRSRATARGLNGLDA